MEPTRPPRTGDEKATLLGYLDNQRATLVEKVAGLTDAQAKWSPVPTGTSLFGLLAHLTMTERWWFSAVVADLDPELPWSDEFPDADWDGPPGATLADIVAGYEEECSRSRVIMAGVDLDTRTSTRHASHERNVRDVVVHMVEETARHAGHADILRELIDGSVGV
ncbi:MAG: hypothetical protein QOE45_1897 [Frankiaceae bacterium]|jgi:hypothetical protein|nr:hypothetical protein [Frankiaceae bacterium]